MTQDDLDNLITRLQRDQDNHPTTQTWWTKDLRRHMRNVYKRRQAALEELYHLRARRRRSQAHQIDRA